jgi:hypothetical protein
MISYIALLTALLISAVSGYYSIIGLTAIFASAFYPVVLMGIVLEAGKLVTASWLHHNWNAVNNVLKYSLSCMVIILMFITSLGVFGFLSRAHIEHSVSISTGAKDQVTLLQQKISFEQEVLEDIDRQIQQIDNAINKMTDRGQAQSSLRAADQQRKNRDSLVKKKEEQIKVLNALKQEKVKYEVQVKKLEAEVGPLKYIAEMIYTDSSTDELEKAVRFVIILLVFVFDPLAVMLLIAANIGMENRKRLTPVKEYDIMRNSLKIDDRFMNIGDVNVAEGKAHKE